MIDSGSWLTNRNRQKWRPATMKILRDFEVFAGTSPMFENKLSGLWPFYSRNKESDRRATMASNIAEVQLKKYIGFVRCDAVIFEVYLKLVCIWRWRIYGQFVLVSLQFAQPRFSCGCSSTCLTKAGRVSQACPGRTDGNLALLRNSKDRRCGAKACPTNTHTYTLYSSTFQGRLSPQVSFIYRIMLSNGTKSSWKSCSLRFVALL